MTDLSDVAFVAACAAVLCALALLFSVDRNGRHRYPLRLGAAVGGLAVVLAAMSVILSIAA